MNIKTFFTLSSRLLTPVDKIGLGVNIRREPSRDRFVNWRAIIGTWELWTPALDSRGAAFTACLVKTLKICPHYSVPVLPGIERYCGSKQTRLVFILIDYTILRITINLE